MQAFYHRHLCRLDPWPDYVVGTFDKLATPIYHYMAGPSEFRIIGTLRDWEQGRTEPDQPAKAYLTLIARDPEHVNRMLNPG